MAPEQCYGEKNIDQRADIWALGVILYECLAGRRPVEGSHVGQLVKRMLADGIVPIEECVPGLAPELAGLIGRMLSREREERPRDLAEVRKVLGRLARKRWDTGVPHAIPSLPASRARAAPRILAGVLAAVALGAVGWSLARFRPHRESAEAVGSAPTPHLMDPASARLPLAATATASPLSVGGSAASVSAQGPAPAPLVRGGTPVRPAQPLDHPAATRTGTLVEAGGVTGKGATLPSASVPQARPKMVDGGLFQEVPF
jgi:hypothetical protein